MVCPVFNSENVAQIDIDEFVCMSCHELIFVGEGHLKVKEVEEDE